MIDVRAILRGEVWPRNPHDFVGDVVDILEEEFGAARPDERTDGAQQVLALLSSDDPVLQTLAVKSLRVARRVLDRVEVAEAINHAALRLDVVPVAGWMVDEPTLLLGALSRNSR